MIWVTSKNVKIQTEFKKLSKSLWLISPQCCVSYRNQSFDLFGFYVKYNTELK